MPPKKKIIKIKKKKPPTKKGKKGETLFLAKGKDEGKKVSEYPDLTKGREKLLLETKKRQEKKGRDFSHLDQNLKPVFVDRKSGKKIKIMGYTNEDIHMDYYDKVFGYLDTDSPQDLPPSVQSYISNAKSTRNRQMRNLERKMLAKREGVRTSEYFDNVDPEGRMAYGGF